MALNDSLRKVLDDQRRILARREGRIPRTEDLMFPADNGKNRHPQTLLSILAKVSAVAGLDIKV